MGIIYMEAETSALPHRAPAGIQSAGAGIHRTLARYSKGFSRAVWNHIFFMALYFFPCFIFFSWPPPGGARGGGQEKKYKAIKKYGAAYFFLLLYIFFPWGAVGPPHRGGAPAPGWGRPRGGPFQAQNPAYRKYIARRPQTQYPISKWIPTWCSQYTSSL